MIIKKSQTTIESLGKGTIWDYPMPNDDIGISYQEHHGRVPERGWGSNTVCYEIYYIVRGNADVYIENEHDTLQEGDMVILLPGQKSYLVANHLRILTITKPNWYLEQYKEVKD